MKSCLLPVAALLVLAACQSTDEQPGELQANPLTGNYDTVSTPPQKRVADQLQEAKQQYDDRQYHASFRYAEQAERLIIENKFALEDRLTAVVIQGYCLLQLGLLQDYNASPAGRQSGALTKFEQVLKLGPDSYPNNFRAQLGIGLTLFRRHGESIRKAEALDQGILALLETREDLSRAMAGGKDAPARLRLGSRRFLQFADNRKKLNALGYIFRDPIAFGAPQPDASADAPWLAGLTKEAEDLAVQDIEWLIQDLQAGDQVEDADRVRSLAALDRVAASWKTAREYWRLSALKDLQAARDGLLDVRRKYPGYFWVNRDLVFVYQSLGGFFLDIALEQARAKAIAGGFTEEQVEREARRIYTDESFKSWEKTESARNYRDALEFTVIFIRGHQELERQREAARDAATFDDINENPFLVDLVQRYRATMDELIAEERGMRASMILEAAALCVDPLFQLNDIRQALVFAEQIRALQPRNPIHYFVTATAHYTDKNYSSALEAYKAFRRDSSITQFERQRRIALDRMRECEDHVARQRSAGGNG